MFVFFLLLKNKRDKRSYLRYVCPFLNFLSSPSESLFSCAPLSVSELPDWQDATLIFTTVSPFTQCCESAVGLLFHQPRETHCSRQSETDRQTRREAVGDGDDNDVCLHGGLTPLTTCQQRQPRYRRREAERTLLSSGCFWEPVGYDVKSKAKHMCMFKLKEGKIQKK